MKQRIKTTVEEFLGCYSFTASMDLDSEPVVVVPLTAAIFASQGAVEGNLEVTDFIYFKRGSKENSDYIKVPMKNQELEWVI